MSPMKKKRTFRTRLLSIIAIMLGLKPDFYIVE